MKTQVVNRTHLVFILVTVLMAFGIQRASYGQTITASVQEPLTEANLHGSVVTLTLTGGTYEEWIFGDVVTVSGIDGVTVTSYSGIVIGVDRVSDMEVTIELEFAGNMDTDATLTFTIGAMAIAGYNGQALIAQVPVTAIEESLEASTESSLTEATLDGSIITLILTGRQFADEWAIGRAVSVSGIDGVTIRWWDIDRISDTEATVELTFDGDFDTDATLTFTVGAEAIAYNKAFTFQFPVTAIQRSNATVSISPSSVVSPAAGEELRFNLNIKDGENVAGYQATVSFDPTALDYVKGANGDYLPADPFFLDQNFYRSMRLAASTRAGAANGDGTLATLTFKAVDFKASTLTLSKVYLVDADGKRWEATTQNGTVTIPPEPAAPIFGDINRDGVVNLQDLAIVNARLGQRGQNSADVNADGLVDVVDLVLVAGAFDAEAAAPAAQPQVLELFTAADVHRWLSQTQGRHLTEATFQSGIRFLEQLLTALTPKESALLPNYPNPFNPETWIPYRLAEDAFVTLTIYDTAGGVVRSIDLGYKPAAVYESKAQAIHWDGRNELGEQVTTGVYFYHLSAGNYSATRKMLIVK